LGLLIGAVLGLVGAGGSIIAVPALVYGVGLSPEEAIPASLIVVGLAALTAVIPRLRRAIDWKTAAVVGAAGVPAAWVGSLVNRTLNQDVLMLLFAGLMVAAGIRMLTATPAEHSRRIRLYLLRALGVGLTVGFLTGLLGIGGGFLITPALILFLGLSAGTAVGTSLVIIVINSIAGLSAHITGANLDWPVILLFSGAAVAGSLIASRYAARLPDKIVKLVFALVVLFVAVFVASVSIAGLIAQ
ncbi:TPA: sulfite exporter TauE/SafE family protein, partial [Enterococcus faecium]|nr:sulfite exporter TauE/SafE family protein [Enterococcus faecium]